MRYFWKPVPVFALIAMIFASNCYVALDASSVVLWIAIVLFVLVNALVGTRRLKASGMRLNICNHGMILLILFLLSAIVSILYHAVLAFVLIPQNTMLFVWSAVFSVGAHFILFWNGILCVYLTSYQLGIKLRIKGLLLGMVPIANLKMLNRIIKTVMDELEAEQIRDRVNAERKAQRVCRTAYPILLVHGVFFRYFKFFNYWGRIPGELKRNGAKIYYGKHHSATSLAKSAEELTQRIKQIVAETGCEKVNVIAHSKGGLDMRYAISRSGVAPYVASLTTINTPHRGCLFADDLLKKAPKSVKQKVADTYNKFYKRLGDQNPDFISAVNDLTAEACEKFNAENETPSGIYCQSVGSVLNNAESGSFPLNLTYHLVDYYNDEGIRNDGLVSESSFAWGEKYTLVTVEGTRGVSHGDMIDLNRENIEEFDVREFYVDLVRDLKTRGF